MIIFGIRIADTPLNSYGFLLTIVNVIARNHNYLYLC